MARAAVDFSPAVPQQVLGSCPLGPLRHRRGKGRGAEA